MRTHHEICIDEVVQSLQEDAEQTEADKKTGESGHDPVDRLLVSGPAEPEDTSGEANASDNDFR